MRERLPLVVLASGRGSNLSAILAAIDAGTCDAKVRAVVSDKTDAGALSLARGRGIATAVVSPSDHKPRAAWDDALAKSVVDLSEGDPRTVVVLAGFMRIVGAALLSRFPSRVINVHPALLPSFPGVSGPADAIAGGVRISGCTVHIVDSGVDTGPILAQSAVPVLPGDTAETLHARIQIQEHRLLPAVLDAVARGALELDEKPRWNALETGAAESLSVPKPKKAGG